VIATVLGIVGPVAAFGMFYLGDKVFHLDHAHLQTLMYLTLSVAGHLTIFLARTRGPFWSTRPARILLVAVLGTQALATLIAVFGVFMTPIGWGYAALVWAYALVWFLLTDPVKLLAYRFLDRKGRESRELTGASAKGALASPRTPGAPKSLHTVAPFHTRTHEDNPVYHDRDDCPYGAEVTGDANDEPGIDGRVRCDWCAEAVAVSA